MVGGWLFLCLLLTFSVRSIAQCPDYPRAMDQVYVCYNGDYTLSFDQNVTIHNPVRFTFPILPSDVTVFFDYDSNDGIPIENVSSAEIKTVSYSAPGQYRLYWVVQWVSGYELDPQGNPVPITSSKSGHFTFQTNFNNTNANYNDFLPNETWGDILGNTYTPPANGAYPPGSLNTLPVTAGGIVHILYANPDHQMRKPFIFVEGFDPILEGGSKYEVTDPSGNTLGFGGVRWDVIVTGRNESFDVDPSEPGVPHTPQFEQLPTLIQGLRNRGYDIVYVDFADAGTYIQANAEFLIDVIERVNNVKITDEENVLVGASMGGIVSRYALAKMENEGLTHCVGLFGTLDTPHNGANIPLAMQGFAWFFHATGSNDLAWKAMDSPAARQQLIQHLRVEVQAGRIEMKNEEGDSHITPLDFSELTNSDYGALRNQLSSDLTGIGWPKQPRKIAMSDGMINGTLPSTQGYNPGDLFYDASGKADGLVNYGTVFKMLMRASNGGPEYGDEYTFHFTENCIKNGISAYPHKLLLSIAKPHDLNPCLGNKAPYLYNVVHIQSNAELLHLDNAPGGFRMDLRAMNASIKSSLESQSGVEFLNPVKFPIATFVPTWSGLAMGTELTNANLFVDLTTGEFQEQNLPNVKIPNFDQFYAPPSSLRHVELDGGMVAFIFEEIDRLDAAPQPGILQEVYNYGDKYKQIPNTTVTSTGVLNVNNPGPTGYVQSSPQSNATKPVFTTYLNNCGQIITVEAGGQYNLGALDKSQHGITEVWKGATVHIKSGGILHLTSEQSSLIIKHGATLILDAGAVVRLDAPGSRIQINGDLVVNGNIIFGGLGYFSFDEGNQLIFGPGYNTFNLSGAGKDKRFVQLNAVVEIGQAHRLNWSNGRIESQNGLLHFSEASGLDFNQMTLNGGGDFAIDAVNSGAITLQNCTVENLAQPIVGVGGAGCNIFDCTFLNIGVIGVDWANSLVVRVKNSIFTSTNSWSMALNMTDMSFLLLDYSATMHGY